MVYCYSTFKDGTRHSMTTPVQNVTDFRYLRTVTIWTAIQTSAECIAKLFVPVKTIAIVCAQAGLSQV